MDTANDFPLDQWFDLSKPISLDDMEIVEAQMALYAIKDGLDPECKEARQAYRQLRAAVKHHNKALLSRLASHGRVGTGQAGRH